MKTVVLLLCLCTLMGIKIRNLVIKCNSAFWWCPWRVLVQCWVFAYWLDIVMDRPEKQSKWINPTPALTWNWATRFKEGQGGCLKSELSSLKKHIILKVIFMDLVAELRTLWWRLTCAFNNSKGHVMQLNSFSVNFWLGKNAEGFKVRASQRSSYSVPSARFLDCYCFGGDEGRREKANNYWIWYRNFLSSGSTWVRKVWWQKDCPATSSHFTTCNTVFT